jgi:hypothetical protein
MNKSLVPGQNCVSPKCSEENIFQEVLSESFQKVPKNHIYGFSPQKWQYYSTIFSEVKVVLNDK